MEWDTEPGVPEVQKITTTTNIGPNEIQVSVQFVVVDGDAPFFIELTHCPPLPVLC